MNCGTCTLCCKLKKIVELDKPVGTWCAFCNSHPMYGSSVMTPCTRYQTRPQSCRDYKCYWLATQDSRDVRVRMPLYFRPDNSRVIIDEHETLKVVVLCDVAEPLAFRKNPMWTFLNQRAQAGAAVYAISGKRVFHILPPSSGGEYRELREDEIVRRGDHIDVVVTV